MNMKYLSILFLTLLFGCSQRDSKIHSFIVPIDTMPNFKNAGTPRLPPPSKSYYFPSNFIIDSAGLIFYYQQQVYYGIECGTGVEWNTPPPFINLKPNDIIEIPSNNIEQFIKSNIQYLDKSQRLFAIASELDTATSVGLANILTVFKDTTNHIKWNFRKQLRKKTLY